ncbi:MAG: ISAs1 family transposase [Mycobacterium sp.]
MPSSLITAVTRHLADTEFLDEPDIPGLMQALAQVPDPRSRLGRRFALPTLVMLSLIAVLGGARSFAAIAQHSAQLPDQVAQAAGVHRRRGRHRLPVASTLQRVFYRVDADQLDAALGRWIAALARDPADQDPRSRRRAIAVDAKTVRGAKDADGRQVHVLAAVEQEHGLVLGQRAVGEKTNEITGFQPLLATMDITGAVITADAMQTQTSHARWLLARGAHYILYTKANQPTLHEQVRDYPWQYAPVRHTETGTRHGRTETRTIKILLPASEIRARFPHVRQIFQVQRTTVRTRGTDLSIIEAYGATSLGPLDATAADLAGYIRGQCSIEAVHHVRDTTYDEDRSQVRTGNAPQAMATLRNTAISLLRLNSWTKIAEANRHFAAPPFDALKLLRLN